MQHGEGHYQSDSSASTLVQQGVLLPLPTHTGSPSSKSRLTAGDTHLHADRLVRHAAHHAVDGAEELQQGLHEVGLPLVLIQSARQEQETVGPVENAHTADTASTAIKGCLGTSQSMGRLPQHPNIHAR
jgi:hypothetical protein